MTRATRVLAALALLAVAWLAVFLELLPLKLSPQARLIVPVVRAGAPRPAANAPHANCRARPQLPWWALVSAGCYSLFSVGWAVATFNDCPDAHAELLRHIDEARSELRRRGLDTESKSD
jgi:dolichyl-phosphate mannosyltransferase polypeptide 3